VRCEHCGDGFLHRPDLPSEQKKPKEKEATMTYQHREWVHVDDGTPCNFVASNPTIPDTEGNNWCCKEHVRTIQAVNWPLNQLVLAQAVFDAKYWEQQFRDMLEAYQTASTAADHLRIALCAFLGLPENPGDAELIASLNAIIATREWK